MRLNLVAAAAILAVGPLLRAADAPDAAAPAADIRDWRYLLTIHEIAKADDDARLKILVTDNPDRTRAQLPDGRTPVHIAAQAGALKSLRVLAKANADLNAPDNQNHTALSMAISAEFTETAKLLLELGADPNKAAADDTAHETAHLPLTLAARHGNMEIVKALLAAKARIDERGPDGQTPITAAANSGQWDTVNLLLDNKADPNSRDPEGVTALLIATAAGNEKEAAILLDKGADPRITDHKGRAPLSLTESPSLWKMLVDKGADVNVVAAGSTPLQYFITAGKVQLVKAWLEYKPDPFVTDRKGHTAKELARLYAEKSSSSYSDDMARREIAQMLETYQNNYAAEQDAKEHPATRSK